MIAACRNAVTALFVAALFTAVPALATDYFAVPAGGSWTSNTTWQTGSVGGPTPPPGAYPGSAAGDTATIPSASATVTLSANVPNAVVVTLGSTLDIQTGGTLPLTGASTAGSVATLMLTGGTVQNTGTFDFGAGSNFTWSSGTLTGAGTTTIDSGAVLTFDGTGDAILTGDARLVNDGNILQIGPVLPAFTAVVINSGAYITNNNFYELGGDTVVHSDGLANARIDNFGTIRKNNGTVESLFDVIVNNSNLVETFSAGIRFDADGVHTGTFIVDVNCFVEFSGGTHTMDGAVIDEPGILVDAFSLARKGIFVAPIAKLTGIAAFDVTTNGAFIRIAFHQTAGSVTGDSGTLFIESNFTWSGGTHSGTGVTDLASTNHTFDGANGSMTISARQMVNGGFVTYAPVGANYLSLNSGALLSNFGTFDITGDFPINSNGAGTPKIVNEGGATFQKSAGAGTSHVAPSLDNKPASILIGSASRRLSPKGLIIGSPGTIAVLSGELALGGGGTNEGIITIPLSTSIITFEGGTYTLAPGTTIPTNDLGIVRVNGLAAILTLTTPLTLKHVELLAGMLSGSDLVIELSLKWSGGTISGLATTVTISASATLDHSAPTAFTDLINRTLINNGVVNFAGGVFGLRMNNGTIQNNTFFNLVGDGAITTSGGTNSFNNAGTLRKTGGTGVSSVTGIALINTGTISSESASGNGVLSVGVGQSGPGTLTTTAGDVLRFVAQPFEVNGGTMTGAGEMQIVAGILRINTTMAATTTLQIISGALEVTSPNQFDISTLLFNGGSVLGDGTTRALAGSIGNLAATGMSGAATLRNAGTFTYDANAANFLTISAPSVLFNEAGATFSITADSTIAGDPGASIVNNGTFRKTGGGGISQLNVPITSAAGTFGTTLGILRVNGGGSFATPIETGVAGTVEFSGGTSAINAGASITGTGSIVVSGATVDITPAFTIPTLLLSGGSLKGSGALSLTNSKWTGGALGGPGSATITGQMEISGAGGKTLGRALTNNGTINTISDGAVAGATGGSLQNNGTFNRTTSAGTFPFGAAVTNAGTVNLLTGIVAFNGGYTQSAGQTVLNGGTFSSPLLVNLDGGSLSGNGTIGASIDSDAVVAPGLSPGLITINGNYTQTNAGTLNIELGGTTVATQYDRLAVNGLATLGGTVNVTLINGFTLSNGDAFDVLTYVTRSGAFAVENLPPFPGGTFTSMYTPAAYRLTAAVTVPAAADLGVTKSGPATGQIGNTIVYTINVTNNGNAAATNVVVSDPTPLHLTFQANAGACTTPYPCTIPSIAAGETKTIQSTYFIEAAAAGTTVVNTVSISDPTPSDNAASTSMTVGCLGGAPANLHPVGSAPTSGTLSWTPGSLTETYDVFLGPAGSGCSMLLGTTSDLSIAYAGLDPNTEYEWRVVSHFGNCPGQPSACVKFTTTDCPPLTAPPIASVIGEATTGKTYSVSWEEIPGATRYEVDEAPNADFTGATTTTVTGATSLQFNHEASQPTAHYYRVRAFNDCSPLPSPDSLTIRVVIIPFPAPDTENPSYNVEAGTEDLIVHHMFIPGTPGITSFFSATTDREWLTVAPMHGTLPPEGVTLEVIADPAELPNGTFTATVIVTIEEAAPRSVRTYGTTVSRPISVNLVTPVTPVSAKAPASQHALIIPAVGHLDGIDSHWQSDVRITNAGFRSNRYKLTFTPSGGTSLGVKQTTITVDAGATMALDDIVRNWYGFGSLNDGTNGMLEVLPLDDAAAAALVTVASSRTYNVTGNGTLGQFIPAIPFPSFIGRAAPGAFSQLLSIQQIAQSTAFRSNFGLAEAGGAAASVLLSVFNAGGTKLLDLPVQLAAGQQLQLNALLAQHNITLDNGRVAVTVTGGDGKVTAYASVVDNGTGDPLLVSGTPLLQTGSTKYVLPGVANTDSAFANWRTDMRIFNYGSAPAPATLTFYPAGNTPRVAQITANPGEVLSLDNVVKTLFNGDNLGGAVHLTTAQPASLIVSGRTYSVTSKGTLGQFIQAVTPEQAIAKDGRTLHILQVEDSIRYRTNIGVTEVTGNPATVELQVVLPDSKITPVVQVPLAANEFRQFSLIRDLGLGNVYNARVSVRVIDGTGRVTAYGSVIDEKTQDPTLVPAQ